MKANIGIFILVLVLVFSVVALDSIGYLHEDVLVSEISNDTEMNSTDKIEQDNKVVMASSSQINSESGLGKSVSSYQSSIKGFLNKLVNNIYIPKENSEQEFSTKQVDVSSKNKEDIKIQKNAEKNAEKKSSTLIKNVKIYYPNINTMLLGFENREYVESKGSIENFIFQQLLTGPKEEYNIGVVPPNTKLISYKTNGKELIVNFNKSFLENGNNGSSGERLLIYSIVNSYTELDEYSTVKFMVDGNVIDGIMHQDMTNGIKRDENLIMNN